MVVVEVGEGGHGDVQSGGCDGSVVLGMGQGLELGELEEELVPNGGSGCIALKLHGMVLGMGLVEVGVGVA